MFFFLIFTSCAIKPDISFKSLPKIAYSDLTNNYKSCEGKGFILSKSQMNGKLYFSYKSQNDSTFIDFSDFLGRKAILMWVCPEKITVRDLINNKYYSYNQIIDFFPFLKVLDSKNITEIIWGAEPNYKKNLKKYKKEMNHNIDIKFKRKNLNHERRALSALLYNDKKYGNTVKVEFKSRKRNKDEIDIKKLWKMLAF